MWPLIELKLHTNLISLDLFHLPHPQADSPEFSSPRSDRMLSPGFSDSPHRAQQAVPFHRPLVPYYGPRPIASLLRWTSQSSLQPTTASQWSICSNLRLTDMPLMDKPKTDYSHRPFTGLPDNKPSVLCILAPNLSLFSISIVTQFCYIR